MRHRREPSRTSIPLGASGPQLSEQVFPFVLELTSRRDDRAALTNRADLRSIENIAASMGVLVNAGQIAADRDPRRRVRLKARQLRMVAVAARRTAQHRSREERFTPERDEPLRIEM